MESVLNNLANYMFSGFWQFVGGILILFIISSVFQFLVEKFLNFVQILLKGYPPAPTNYITNTNEKEEGKGA